MKSATTYIQSLCHANAERLGSQGIWCPPPGLNFAGINVLLGSAYIRPWNAGAWDQLAASIQAHDTDVFLSNEILSLRSRRKASELVDAFAPAEVHVLLTARDLARVIPSQWQEGAANGQTVRWSRYVASVCSDDPPDKEIAGRFWRRHDLPQILQRWHGVVPPGRTTLLTVPRDGLPGVLSARCAEALNADFTDFEQPAPAHTSLGAHSAELMRRLNHQLSEVDTLHYRTGFHQTLARSVLAHRAAREPRIALSAEQHDWAVRRAQRMVLELKSFNVRVIGDLEELVSIPFAEGSGASPDNAADSDVLAAALDGLAEVTLQLADLRIAHDELRGRRNAAAEPSAEANGVPSGSK